MNHFINQSNGAYRGHSLMGRAMLRRFALFFPMILLMLLFLPGRMVAQTDYEEFVKLTVLEGDPGGYAANEGYANLVDGQDSKWCCSFISSAYVIFEASKAGVPVGYTITTGNDNEEYNGRNPLSWKLYGNNEGKDGAWTLIQEVDNDKVLQDVNNTSYDFPCEKVSTSYKYFKWEITAIQNGSILQVSEFKLKFNTCSHENADGSSALGKAIKTVEATCTEPGYTTKECSICHFIVKVYKDDELKPHTLTHHEAKAATCTETGKEGYWQCSVCNKLFSDKDATTEITDAGKLEIPANGHKFNSEGTCTVCQYKDSRYALFNGLDGITDVTITDNGNPWKKLDLKADGMDNLGFTIPEDSKGLMSSNYNVDVSSSETVIKFNVSKPILLTSQVLVSSEEDCDNFSIFVDNKLDLCISGLKQTEYKVLLSAGEHSLKVCYQKDDGVKEYADRAFLYDLKTATTFSEYVAEYDATNTTLTFKNIPSSNLEDQSLDNIVMMCKAQTVSEMCSLLNIEKSAIKNIVFDKSFNTYAPTSLKCFFMDLTELETIKDLKYLNTEKVTEMQSMFDGCQNLSSLDLSSFNTAEVGNMLCMFYNCQSLSSLDLSSFNTAKVENMAVMFKGCSALTTIYAGDKFVTTKVLYGSEMFYNCTSLKGTTLEYDASKTDRTYANCGTNGYFTPACGYAEFDNATGTLTFGYKGVKPEEAYDLNVETNSPGWYALCENIEKVVFDASFANAKPTSCYAWFQDCQNLTDIEGIEYFNTEKVTNMNSMFSNSLAITSLDLSNFNTAKVENMASMFNGCSALTTIYASKNFVTDQVTNGDDMFSGCTNLKGVIEYAANKVNKDYANYATGYFTPEGGFPGFAVFDEDTGTLTFKWDTSIPQGAYALNEGYNYPEWYWKRHGIQKVVFDASFANARPTSCYCWFRWCSKLTNIEGIGYLNTEKVTNMRNMFVDYQNLSSLDLSNFNTAKVEDMQSMFAGCQNLSSLDLSSFNTAKVEDMASMFSGCSALTTIYAGDKFVTTNVLNGSNMFNNCTSLKGAIIEYDASKTDHTYANYKTGYFTKLVGKNGDEKIGATGETLATDNLVLDDGKDFVAYEPFAAKAASYSRTINAGTKWTTLCLPFEVSLADKNFRAFKLLSADEGTETVELEEIKTSIEAGTPVIIKMNDGATKLSFTVADKEIAKDVQTAETANGNYQLQGLYTQKEFSKDADNNCYIVKGSKLMNPAKLLDKTTTESVGSKPFRAYMVDNSSAPAAGARMFCISVGGSTTAIEQLESTADSKAEYYDLQGRRLQNLQKGVNIVKRGGKTMKVIIK